MIYAAYLSLGYSLFPCRDDKAPATPHGFHDAVSSEQDFADLLARCPGPNLGLPIPPGALVLDVDIDPAHGVDGLLALRQINPTFEADSWPGPIQRSPRGGWHLFARCPPWHTGNGHGSLPEGVDVRGPGAGYVCVEPSRTSAGAYHWSRPLVPVEELPELPDWIAELLRRPKSAPRPAVHVTPGTGPCRESACDRWRKRADAYCAKAFGAWQDLMASASHRHEQLLEISLGAGALVSGGLCSEQEAEEAVRIAASCATRPMDELDRVLRDAFRHAADQPKHLPPCDRCMHSAKPRERPALRIVDPPEYVPDPDNEPPPFEPDIGCAATPTPEPGSADSRPVIEITYEEMQVNNAAVSALTRDRHLWQRAPGQLVTVIAAEATRKLAPDEDLAPGEESLAAGTPQIAALEQASLRERMAEIAQWVRYDARTKSVVGAHPPGWSVAAVHARGTWRGIPTLRGIVEYPVMRHDGTFATAPGYDPQTGYYVSPSGPHVEIPAAPTLRDCVEASKRLFEIVEDFPFADPIGRATWLSLLLTALARPAISGPTPLVMVTANTRGAGKDLLCNAVGQILSGRELPAVGWTRNKEELEKILVSVALAGYPILNLSNATGSIGNDVLDRWLASTRPTGRILGLSSAPVFDWTCILACTGNNSTTAADTDRRSIYIRLESPHERPELRTDLHHPDLLAHVGALRASLLGDACTILLGHALAGRPAMGRPKGTYGAWAGIVRDAITWIGQPDIERAPDDPERPEDESAHVLDLIIESILECGGAERGVSVAGLIEHLSLPTCPECLSELASVISTRGSLTTARLGAVMRSYHGRWRDGRSIVVSRTDTRRVWTVRSR
jgi:hypothetical protein